ncbi:S8 family serine peptidase [Actinomadura sp. ATCC 31491]|uniref:S8 family serine peptidase n=1 Tax=Actinomadura luzonensis TaxID=2805427 RepID=A0ABT0FWN0_9ACTN|nr:S8 family serine peptidase [Actinomadura luzonensis]MCK2216674.1 S8 family serine peptidase [Actinomadura luzonensis]
MPGRLGRAGRRRRGTVTAGTLALTAALLAAPTARAEAAQPVQSAQSAQPAQAARATAEVPVAFKGAAAGQEITLITGDRVRVRAVDGGHSAVTVTPAPRADGSVPAFQVLEADGEVSVIPDDVADLVPARLDGALFNVTALAGEGYGADLPLILTYAANAPKAALPAVRQVRTLESIGGAGVTLAAADAPRFGAELTRPAPPGTLAAGPLSGVTKIWLDRKVRPGLAHSVPRIGAPAAWAAGFDGAGTTVAVLDTGVDATHPDLAGRVAARRDLTGTDAAGDPHGHGTHVASTVAGAKGVAPGAKLLDGRVLDADGYGLSSWIIDGMEWAAVEQHADIVNLSLGSPEPGGPLTDAVSRLSAAHGTLFVVAAGNDGCDRCVGGPGDAPEALTVGAVDGEDRPAGFSSRGPAGPDDAVKPDVTAPGVDITAARTGGGEITMSGTSMAAPHVAGAAALLRQARPGLTAAELKSLLMASAVPGGGVPADTQGAGRIDVAAALRQTVVAASGTAAFGRIKPGGRESRTVTYRNLGQAPAELTLSAGDGFRVEPATLTVPAAGTARATVTIEAAEPGALRRELTASVPGAGPPVRTLLSATVEEPRVELRVRGVARDGRPARGGFTVLNLDEGTLAGRLLPGDPAQPCSDQKYGAGTCLLVRPGTYAVLGHVFTMPADQDSTASGTPLNESLLGDPELTITKDTELVLDARKAVEVQVETPDHETKRNTGAAAALMWYRAGERGTALRGGTTITPGSQIEERLFVQPTRKVTKGTFVVATRWRLKAPEIAFTAPGLPLTPEYVDPVQFSDLDAEYPRLDGTRLLLAVDAGRGTPQELARRDLRGRLAVVRRTPGVPVATQANAAAAAGAAMVAVYADRPGTDVSTGGSGVRLAVPTVRLSHEDGLALTARLRLLPVPVLAKGVPASPYGYDLYLREQGRVPDRLRYTVRARSLARIDTAYHSQLAGDVTVDEARFPFEPWDSMSISTNLPLAKVPRTRADYVTPDPGVRWSTSAISPERPYNTMWPHPDTPRLSMSAPEFRAYEAGERAGRTMFKQPLLPGVNPGDPVRREGDLLRVSMQGFVDGGGNFGEAYTSDFERGLRTDFRLYRDDELLWRTNYLPAGAGTVPAARSRYRIEYDVVNEAEWAKLSTRTRAVWTFASGHAAGTEVLPLLTARFDAPVDLRNQAASRTLRLAVAHQEGAAASPVRDVTLEVSYDDGATWHATRLRGTGEGGYATTLARATGGFVSLRLKAADAAGDTLSQEVIRAYALR